MKSIGENIAELRKQKGMTQEELAGIIGVSAQSVSKWENSATMPDIMLLPIISDVFGISVDSLFGIDGRKTQAVLFNDVPEEAFDVLLRTMWRAFNEEDNSTMTPEAGAELAKKHISEYPDSQTAIYSDKGGAVYANHEIGVIFRKSDDKLYDLLRSEAANGILTALADKTVLKIMEYQLRNSTTSFTAASAAAKLGTDVAEAQRALDILVGYSFTSCRTVDTGDSKIEIYFVYAGHKMLLVYSVLRLAQRLATYQENYYGFRGVPDTWLC